MLYGEAHISELVMTQEMSRLQSKGYSTGLEASITIGLPPVKNFGREPMRTRVINEVLNGDKVVSLAITEAFAGSDVANIKSRAVRQSKGWILNGTKKWITGGMYSDYFTIVARTYGGSAPDGALTCFLVARGEGVKTSPIPTMYSAAAGTAYVTFDDVFVPDEHMLGEEGKGQFIVLSNFNHERWSICCGLARSCRLITEECLLWAAQRRVFDKPLLSQPVIRLKLAGMIGKCEAVQAWLESITHQMCLWTTPHRRAISPGRWPSSR
jgi:alkylation response protein AidB-like acyl-CoA dehydrogenase